MAISGQQLALAAQLTATITQAIEAQFGGVIAPPQYVFALATGIANAIIPFLVSNIEVNVGQTVTVPGTNPINPGEGLFAGSFTVTGATIGTTNSPGTIS
jgi:hypothetical protein